MGKKERIGLTLIVKIRFKKLLYPIERLFFAPIVKNNKVDPNYAAIYTL